MPEEGTKPSLRERRTAHAAYLRTSQWAALRLKALERDGHACRICNRTKKLHVHHRTYERWGEENVDDLTTLCEKCHNIFHRAGLAVLSFQLKAKRSRKKEPVPTTHGRKHRVEAKSKAEARARIREALGLLALGEIVTTADIAVLAEVQVSRTGGFLAGMARRNEGVQQLGKGRWRIAEPQVKAA